MHGRVGSAFSNDRFTQRSRIGLVPRRQLVARRCTRSRLRAAVALDADRDRRRVVVRRPRHDRRDGGRAGRPRPRPGRPPGARTLRAYPHCSGKSCSRQHARARRRRRRAARGRCGRGRAARRARRRPRARCRDASSSGVASASAGRVGSRLAPLRNRRSPLTEHTQSFHATSRSPVRRRRRSLSSPSTTTSIDISVSGWSPSERGHHSAGLLDVEVPADLVVPAGERSLGLGDRAAVDERAHAHARGGRRCRARA